MTIRSGRERLRAVLDGDHPRWGRPFARLLAALVLGTAVAVALETVDSLPLWLRRGLALFEIAAALIFAAEYVARLAAARRPLRYAVSFFGIVDLVSFLPTLLLLGTDLLAARVLRLLRLLRLLKLVKHESALDNIVLAVRDVADELVVVLAAAALVLYLSAVGIYLFEHEAQPEAFSSIPASLWWAVATLTTVGYGDVYPVTAGGRVFTGLVLLIGLGIVSVPTALIATALTARASRRERHRRRTRGERGDRDDPDA
ncbi:MAG: potassium channel family protein [Paracoccaceae bacterium]